VIDNRQVRIPARHLAKDQARALAITGGDIADIVRITVADRLFASVALLPNLGVHDFLHALRILRIRSAREAA
jgi:hypothetical protein